MELHEGFRRLATTARIGWPLLPAWSWGEADEPDKKVPQDMATHPGLPAVTPDLRRPSRAIKADAANPAARTSLFDGQSVTWRQLDRHGGPCFPNSFEDQSRRTVDLRTPDVAYGRYHPRRVLVFYPPPTGFFPRDTVRFEWSDRDEHPEYFPDGSSKPHRISNPSPEKTSAAISVTVEGDPDAFTDADVHEIERIHFDGTVTVDSGRLVLREAAFRRIVVHSPAGIEPVLEARDCLFDEIEANGLVRLVGCTVMKKLSCTNIQASDCILPDDVTLSVVGGDPGCIRYSRVPPALLGFPPAVVLIHKHSLTTVNPVFADFKTCVAGKETRSADFGSPGYGVLDPATPESISAGAETGGEMGAYGHRRYCLQRTATQDKLRGFLPLGIEAVLIADPRLLQPPPALEGEE